jgi:hypothetical protein
MVAISHHLRLSNIPPRLAKHKPPMSPAAVRVCATSTDDAGQRQAAKRFGLHSQLPGCFAQAKFNVGFFCFLCHVCLSPHAMKILAFVS